MKAGGLNMKREVWPKILRLVLNVSQFLVTIVCVLAVVVISSPYPPNPLFSFGLGLAVVLIVYLLINRPVREIALGFVKGWREQNGVARRDDFDHGSSGHPS
jgi:hypothetical protein